MTPELRAPEAKAAPPRLVPFPGRTAVSHQQSGATFRPTLRPSPSLHASPPTTTPSYLRFQHHHQTTTTTTSPPPYTHGPLLACAFACAVLTPSLCASPTPPHTPHLLQLLRVVLQLLAAGSAPAARHQPAGSAAAGAGEAAHSGHRRRGCVCMCVYSGCEGRRANRAVSASMHTRASFPALPTHPAVLAHTHKGLRPQPRARLRCPITRCAPSPFLPPFPLFPPPPVMGTRNTTPAVYSATLLCTNPCNPRRLHRLPCRHGPDAGGPRRDGAGQPLAGQRWSAEGAEGEMRGWGCTEQRGGGGGLEAGRWRPMHAVWGLGRVCTRSLVGSVRKVVLHRVLLPGLSALPATINPSSPLPPPHQ